MADNTTTKVLTVDHLEYIKGYVDAQVNNVNIIVNDINEYVEKSGNIDDKLDAAKTLITTEYNDKLEQLEKDIAARIDGNSDELNDLLAELETLKKDTVDKLNLLNELQETINGVNESVFTESEINKLINAALIKETTIDGNSIGTEQLFAEQIVSLIADFGTIKAQNINGTEISGLTVKAPGDNPAWQLNKDGSGHLANSNIKWYDTGAGELAGGNIKWNENGDITLGPGVTLTWDNITDKGKQDLYDTIDYSVLLQKSKIASEISEVYNETINSINASINELEASTATAITNINEQLENIQADFVGRMTEAESKTQNAISAAIDELMNGSSDDGDKKSLNDLFNEIQQGLDGQNEALNAYKQSLEEQMNSLDTWCADIDTLKASYDNLQMTISSQNATISAINNSISNLKNSATNPDGSVLTEDQIADILKTALISVTSISGDNLSTPELLAKEIVGLVANFGTVKASNIQGDVISGKTFESGDKDDDGNPLWQICSSGDGYFAGGKISWDNSGLKIDGESIMEGIKNNDTAQNKLDELIAGKVDAKEISTTVLETKPSANIDKIHIEDNYIYCINEEGRRNLKISSNPIIDPNCLDALFTPVSKTNDTQYVAIKAWNDPTSTGTSNKYTNKYTTFSCQGDFEVDDPEGNTITCAEIGYLFKDSKIGITIKVALIEELTYQNKTTRTIIDTNDWTVITGNVPSWGLTQSGTSVSKTGGYLLLYKYNPTENVYKPYTMIALNGSWQTTGISAITFNPGSSPGNVYRVTTVDNISIDEDGIYAAEIFFEPKSIMYTSTSLAGNTVKPTGMHLNIRFIIQPDQALPTQYTEIGKDGLITFNNDTALALNTDGVMIKAKKSVNNGQYDFYGVKVNKNGIYIGNGSSDWKQLNMDKLAELFE